VKQILAMWLFVAAGLIQCLLLFERILYRLLLPFVVTFFVDEQRSEMQEYADKSVVSAVFATVLYYCAIPVNFVLLLAGAVWEHIFAFLFLLFFSGVLLILSDNFQRGMLLIVDTYNSGMGQTLDLVFMVMEVWNFVVGIFLPLYNSMVWFAVQFVKQVLLPLLGMREVLTQLPDFFGNLSLLMGSLTLSLSTFLQNWLFCVSGADNAVNGATVYNFQKSNYTQNIPFTAPNLQCVVNHAFYSVDLMTPGSYMQKSALNVQSFVHTTCAPAGFLIELAFYPLTDFNMYKCVHCLVNSVIFTFAGLPVMTYKRCNYAKQNDDYFHKEEIDIMCSPDWKPWVSMITESVSSLGKLVDNWLDVSLAMVERVRGVNQNLCQYTGDVKTVTDMGSELLLESAGNLRYVQLTENMYAITNGESTMYHTVTDRTISEMAIGNWPFQINLDSGIAAIKVAETDDRDIRADARTGMLGCTCVDEAFTGVSTLSSSRMRILCASVPYVVFDDNQTMYNTTTVQEIQFVNDNVRTLMTCQDTLIQVHTLRFSRKRVADGIMGSGPLNDVFNTMRAYGATPSHSYTADAVVYIQPKCSDNTLAACIPGLDSCFPYCFGLHLAGQTESNITVYNAKHWDSYVTVTQTDCVGGTFVDYESGEECEAMGLAYNLQERNTFSVRNKPVCDVARCVTNEKSNTLLELSRFNAKYTLNHSLLINKTKDEYSSWVRLETQPFAVAGDVLLSVSSDADETEHRIRITRLYDTSNGQFTLQQEFLNLLHEESVGVLNEVTQCATKNDDSCYTDAMRNNQIVLPPSYFYTNATYVLATASEWGVHWAINPENFVYESRIKRCQGINQDDITTESSYAKPRIWTLKSMRVTNLEDNVVRMDNDVSFMVVPNWLDASEDCDAMAGMRITALEYINEENILVTVLSTSKNNYNLETQTGYDPDKVKYEYYYLHPTRHDCFDVNDPESGIFSCYQHYSEGMFTSSYVANNNALLQGAFCPAMRRMPQIGSALAETLIVGVEFVKLILDAMVVLPVAYMDTVFDQTRTRPTFHSNLHGDFLNINPLLESYARANMHVANTLPRLGRFFQTSEGRADSDSFYNILQPRLIGTAKVVQHMGGIVPLTGPLLMQLKAVQAFPVKETLYQMYAGLKTTKSSVVIERIKNVAMRMAGVFRLNVKMMKEAVQQGLNAMAKRAQVFGRKLAGRFNNKARFAVVGATSLSAVSFVTTTLFESERDLRRYLIDILRIQCHGLGEMVGHDNVLGHAVRDACLLVPEALQGVVNLLLVLGVDYPLMDCVCKQSREFEAQDIVVHACLEKLLPSISRVFVMEYLDSSTTALGENKCFVYMDQANTRLLQTFDPLLNRMYLTATSMAAALDFVLVFFPGYDAGQCFDYEASPYVMAIVPEPVDYFMACSETYDCRAKCSDTFASFDAALASVGSIPVLKQELELMVDSRFFSDQDILDGKDILPFPVSGMQELSLATCRDMCEQVNVRCLVLFGLEHINVTAAYYCIPTQFMQSVYRQYPSLLNTYSYQSEWSATDKVVSMFALTTANVGSNVLEVLLMSVMDTDTSLYSIWLFTERGIRYKILETRNFDAEAPGSDVRDAGSEFFHFESISNIRVQPSHTPDEPAIIWFEGVREWLDVVEEDVQVETRCMQKTVFMQQQDVNFGHRIITEDCTSQRDKLLSTSYKIIRMFESATTYELWLPLDTVSISQIYLYNTTGLDTNTLSPNDADRFEVQDAIYDFVKVVSLDPAVPVILTEDNVALINRKFIADTSETAYSVDGAVIKINLLLVGSLSNVNSWIHNVRLELDTTNNKYAADVQASETVSESMEIEHVCTINDCAACQTEANENQYKDLQMKCYAAAECAVARCVGTLVNMQKPLCNLGSDLIAGPLHVARIVYGYLWLAIAEKIIAIVELTKQRREVYEFSSRQQFWTALNCQLKDELVLHAAVYTSLAGALTSFIAGFARDDLSPTSSLIDSNANAKVVMSAAAMTNLISSFQMWPVYLLIVGEKLIECKQNALVSILNNVLSTSGVQVQISLNDETISASTGKTVGVCLTEFDMEMSRSSSDTTAMQNLQRSMKQIVQDMVWLFLADKFHFNTMRHIMDAILAYIYGVITAVMDVIQVIDWKNCKLPETSFRRVDHCACGDDQVRIPDSRSQQKVSSLDAGTASLWCSGPMLLTGSDGKEILIWNPYSLYELLHPDTVVNGYGNYETYLACIFSVEGGSTDACEPPFLPDLEEQDVSVLQVVTRCRSNYQQSRWDTGSLLLGLYSLQTWRDPNLYLNENLFTHDSAVDRYLLRFLYLKKFMQSNPHFLDENTWACLYNALQMQVTEHTCAQTFYQNRNEYGSINQYFQYQHTSSSFYMYRDACRVYSGSLRQPPQGIQFSPILWQGMSSNKVPLAKLHYIDFNSNSNRLQQANNALDELINEIKLFFEQNSFNTQQANQVQVTYNAWEGDSFHQFVDCVVLGPYAAADLQASFVMLNNQRLPVPQYHRGNPSSRAFTSKHLTAGSEARKIIIRDAFEHVQETFAREVENQMLKQYREIEARYRIKDNMLCICKNLTRSWECCLEAQHENDIHFALKGELYKVQDLKEELHDAGLQALKNSTKLQEDIWANKNRTFHIDYTFSTEEMLDMAKKYMFDHAQRISRYSSDEVLTEITEHTLWERCTQLVSTPFFTLPLKTPETLEREGKVSEEIDGMHVDANTFYDPITPPLNTRDEYLHGMEHAIAHILEQARDKSPVFWTHVHRYIASDSVWCEDLHAAPEHMPLNWKAINDTFYNINIEGVSVIESEHAGDVQYPARISCLCGWGNASHCILDAEVKNVLEAGLSSQTVAQTSTTFTESQDALLKVLEEGVYTTRAEYFLLAEAMYHYDVPLTNCMSHNASMTWGLLDTEQHVAWFQGTLHHSENSNTKTKLDWHGITTHGPAGIRLGMMKADGTDALEHHLHHFDFKKKVSSNQTHNWQYQHTVGQPTCSSTQQHIFDNSNLTHYLRDTLFPMAHSVFEAPVSAYCSTWAIEYALWVVMHYVKGEADTETLIQQEREKLWKERCDMQLQQIGICNLRGVFDMQPVHDVDNMENVTVPSHCPFVLAPNHGCIYVTENCLVQCNGEFFDPCLCTESCAGFEFAYSNCMNSSILHPGSFALHEDVLLYSLHWPSSIQANEAGNEDVSFLNELLASVNAERAKFTFESVELHEKIAQLIVEQDAAKEEDNMQDEVCTDLFDYFEGTEQHPVGYHPTRTCAVGESALRGFDAWMSLTEDGWAVDPIILRNMTQYSQVFGISHLVCDTSVYGALGHELNPYVLETKWNAQSKVDMAVPLSLNDDILDTMSTYGTPSNDATDTPCVFSTDSTNARNNARNPSARILQHSVGLIRDWLRLYGADEELQNAYNEFWPHWVPSSSSLSSLSSSQVSSQCFYSMQEVDTLPNCNHPPLFTCVEDNECATSTSTAQSMNSLICLKADEEHGICAQNGTCFRHSHCADGLMCSGDGECVQPRIYFENTASKNMQMNFQLFASEQNAQCRETMHGISEHQMVPDFATSHGLCSLRNWFVYHNISSYATSEQDKNYIYNLEDRMFQRPEDEQPESLLNRQMLQTQPHQCDRDYQYTAFHYCQPKHITEYDAFSDNPLTTVNTQRGIRTWKKGRDNMNNSIEELRMCNLQRYSQMHDLLHPYAPDASLGDTLAQVPNDVRPCTQFQVCENFQFHVDYSAVSRRRKIVSTYDTNTGGVQLKDYTEQYSNNDADVCFGLGHIVHTVTTASTVSLCIVDRLVMPLLAVLFGAAEVEQGLIWSSTPLKITENAMLSFTESQQSTRFAVIRQHCPKAFTQTINQQEGQALYKQFMTVLSSRFTQEQREDVVQYANALLLSLFGLDSTTAVNRGFNTIEEYLQHSACARFLSSELQKLQEATRDFNVYVQESTATPQTPGASVYIFHERAPIPLNLHWFWKCVLMHNAVEGGAPSDWMQRLSDADFSTTHAELSCAAYTRDLDELADTTVTVKTLLQRSSDIFMTDGDFFEVNWEQSVEALAESLLFITSNALDAIGLTQTPRLTCMKPDVMENSDWFDNSTCHDFYAVNTCWLKFCEGENCDNTGFDADYNLYNEVLTRVFDSTDMLLIKTMNYQSLRDQNLAAFELSLDTEVSKTSNIVPFIRFHKITETVQNATTFEDFSITINSEFQNEANIETSYANKTNTEQCPWRLYRPEFSLNHFDYAFHDTMQYKYLSFGRATIEVVMYVARELYSPNVLPSNNNLHKVSDPQYQLFSESGIEFADRNEEINQQTYLSRAYAYNHFMRMKNYACSDSNDVNINLETNFIPRTMRACIEEMQEDIGWGVQPEEVLQLRVNANTLLKGFYPTFSEQMSGTKFLDAMFSELLVDKTSILRSVCFSRNDRVQVMNPLWAGDFDVTSCPRGQACGCDTRVQDNFVRYVDTRCTTSAGQTCRDTFPLFDELLQNKLASHCAELGATRQPVTMFQQGTLNADETPLCSYSTDTFNRGCEVTDNTLYGALHGWKGSTLDSLHNVNNVAHEEQAGIFIASNSIFRQAQFKPTLLPTLRVLKTDIGGHALHFDLGTSQANSLQLRCILLSSNPPQACTSNSRTSREWLQDLEAKFNWQHDILRNTWPDFVVSASASPPSWKCPLQWVSAYSGGTQSFAARLPNRDRNKVRFKHITGDYNTAHPTVKSVMRTTQLQPAYFKAEHIMCAVNKESCVTQDQLDDVLQTVYHRDWKRVKVEGSTTKCGQIVDWPEQGYILRDETNLKPTGDECFVLDRLPRFGIKIAEKRTLTPTNTETSASMMPGGACHMGRLHQLDKIPGEAYDNLTLHMCGQFDWMEDAEDMSDYVTCLATNHSSQNANNVSIQYVRFIKKKFTRKGTDIDKHVLFSKRKCNQCARIQSRIMDRHRQSHNLASQDINSTQLSVGIPTRLSTERMIAAYLRRKVCPLANETACTTLTTLFNTSKWERGQFLPLFLNTSRYNELFIDLNSSKLPVFRNEENFANDDAKLWSRPWVFCDQSSTNNQGCKGSIPKADWIQPATRMQRCSEVTQAVVQEMNTLPTINFCELTAQTEELCTKMVSWNTRIQAILCQSAGICSDEDFFYNPGMYALDNQAFVSSSVRTFYNELDADACVDEVDNLEQTQIDSNKQAKQKCGSVQLEFLRFIIREYRVYVHMLYKIVYYFLNLLLYAVHIVIAGIIEATSGEQVIGDALVQLERYFKLFVQHLGNFVRFIIDFTWKFLTEQEGSFGKALRTAVRETCQFVAMILGGLCDAVTAVHDFLHKIIQVFEHLQTCCEIDLGFTKVAIFYPLLALVPFQIFVTITYSNYYFSKGLMFLFCVNIKCPELAFDSVSSQFSATLPVPTRCWSSYTTFFGDTAGLSCTTADTCVSSHLDINSLKVCGTCADTGNTAIQQFGCDPLLKMCMCGVVKHERTYCQSNAECRNPSTTCAYIDRDLEVSFSNVDCSACQTNRVCYFNSQEDEVGFCACPLFKTEFSRCRAQDQGLVLSPNPDAFCLLQTDAKFASSVQYSTSFDNSITTPCYTLDVSQIYCTHVVDIVGSNTFFLVGLQSGTGTPSRRLLQIAQEHNTIITHNALCQDALQEENAVVLQHTREACIQAFTTSSETIIMLNASLPPCAFCSSEDLLHTITHNSVELINVVKTVRHLLLVMCRHGPGQHVYSAMKAILKASRLLMQDFYDIYSKTDMPSNSTDYFENAVDKLMDLNQLLSPPLQPISYDEILAASSNISSNATHNATPPSHLRHILGFKEIIAETQRRTEAMLTMHTDYSSQLATTFDYEYANLYTESTYLGWFSQWPVSYTITEESSECLPMWHTLGILEQAVTNATLPFTPAGRDMKGTPAQYLHEAWPRIAKVTNSSEWTNGTNNNSLQEHSGIVGSWKWLLEKVFEWLKLGTNQIYDLLFATSKELKNSVICDLRTIQTCSKWRITLLHSTIIASVWFSLWFLIAQGLKMPFATAASMFMFIPLILYMSYEYSPLCAPMVPICFLEDLLHSLRAVFPRVMHVPAIFIHNTQVEGIACQDFIQTPSNNIWVSETRAQLKIACIKSCADAPFEFDSWRAVFAWFTTEFGQGAVDWVSEAQQHVPLLNHQDMLTQLQLKNKIWQLDDADMLLGHRICAFAHSYQIIPFIISLLFILLILRTASTMLAAVLIPVFNVIAQVVNAFFVKHKKE